MPDPTTSSPSRRSASTVLLVLVCLAQFMVILDVSIVNVALPSIRGDLHFSATGLQWVVNAYTLTFAGFLLLGGRAADLVGRRRVFLAGVALFSVSSLVCALASSQGLLLGARALQGLGGAIVSPASLAIITTSFGEGAERNRALGTWGAMAGLGGAAGVLFGGLLTQGLGWPAIFVINVPIGLAVVVAARRVIPESRREADAPQRHFDLAGALLVTLGLVAVVYGIVRTDVLGWGSIGVLAPLAAGLVLLAAFAVVEGRIARDPLIPLRVFAQPLLRAANLTVLLLGSALFAMWFFVSLYLQQVLGYDALQAGLAFLPMTLTIVAASTQAPRLVARLGVRVVLTVGLGLAALGLAWFSRLAPGGSYVLDVLPGGLLAATGMGLSLVPATIAAVQGVPASESGLASGLINTSRLMGGALGLAALSTLASSRTGSALAGGTARLAALSDGFDVAFLAGAGILVIAAVVAATLVRPAEHGVHGRVPEPVADAA